MKSNLLSFILSLTTTILLASCLGNTDGNTTTYYDSAISSFRVGTLNKYLTTTDKDGKTTVKKVAVDCSKYKFYIDQATHTIYNPDSLPAGLDIKHVIATCATKNNGVITIKSMTSDSVRAYSTRDSIDFSQPRVFTVYNHTGQSHTVYTVKVNMHKEEADDFRWNLTTVDNDGPAALTDLRMLACGGSMYLLGRTGGETAIYKTSESSPNGWQKLAFNLPKAALSPANITALADKLYLLADGKLYVSTDGSQWDEVAPTTMTKLLGASTARLYGLSADNGIVSSTDGKDWKTETMDAGAALLPQENIRLMTLPSLTNENINHLVLIGNPAAANTTDSTACIWSKVEDNSETASVEPWSYNPVATGNPFKALRLTNLQTARYDDALIAFGGDGMGTGKAKAFGGIYASKDKGVTWKRDSTMALPAVFKSSKTHFAMAVDSKKFIWIFCGESGQLWKGRHAAKGWATEQKKFEK